MLKSIAAYIARRAWAHRQACYVFGRKYRGALSWWERRKKYDGMFREYMRIGKLMELHDNSFN